MPLIRDSARDPFSLDADDENELIPLSGGDTDCPTDLDAIERKVRRGLRIIRRAILLESSKRKTLRRRKDDRYDEERWTRPGSAAVAVRKRRAYEGWERETDDAWTFYLKQLPGKVRHRLTFLKDVGRDLFTVWFQTRRTECLWWAGELPFPSWWNGDPRKPGVRIPATKRSLIVRLLSYEHVAVVWPPIDRFIAQAVRYFESCRRTGIEDFTPTVDAVKGLILEIVGRYQLPWARQAEHALDANDRFVKRVISRSRPVNGVRVRELAYRVREDEPAASNPIILTALYELGPESARRLRIIEHVELQRDSGENGTVRCWVLNQRAKKVSHQRRRRSPGLRRIPTKRQGEAWALYASLGSHREVAKIMRISAQRAGVLIREADAKLNQAGRSVQTRALPTGARGEALIEAPEGANPAPTESANFPNPNDE